MVLCNTVSYFLFNSFDQIIFFYKIVLSKMGVFIYTLELMITHDDI